MSDACHGFATTRWTMVNAAGEPASPAARVALEQLCETYWPPLYSYLRRRGHDREQAEDLTQGFFAKLLEGNDIRVADPARGRFRGFLLTVLKRYVVNEHERATAARRGGRQLRFVLDFDEAERTYAAGRGADDTPDRAFDRKWASVCIDRALASVRAEYEAAGKARTASALLPYLTDSGELPSYRDVAEQLHITEGAVKVAVHRLRQRFGAALRQQVADTVLSPEDTDDEIRELMRVVAS